MNHDQKRRALARFSDLYQQQREIQRKLEEAAQWIINQGFCPYRVGDWVNQPAALGAGGFEIATIRIHADPATGRLYWALSNGKTNAKANGFIRVPIEGQPEAATTHTRPPEQPRLF